MTIDQIIKKCRDLLDLLPDEALEEARKRHPDVGGFAVFPVYAPIEIVHAAGLMPVGMFGAGEQVELTLAESRFASFICSIAKSTLELFLQGRMDVFVGAAFSSICDVARNLSSVVKRNAPNLYIEYLHLPQNMNSEASLRYTRAEFARFRDNLSAHMGRPISDAAIAESLLLYNRIRAMIRDLYAYRRAHVGAIPASEMYILTKAGTRMMPEDYAELLETYRTLLPERKVRPRDGVHVIIEGAFCEQPPIGLLEVIESAGCHVRDDDMMVGWRVFLEDVPCNGDPLGALASSYLAESVYTSVRHDGRHPRTDGLVRRLKDAGAEAVLFTPAKFCEPALLDYVLFRTRLEKLNLPHLKIEFEEKMWTFEGTRNEIETFAESMLFD